MSARRIEVRRLAEADAPAFRDVRLRSLRDHPDAYASTPAEWGEAIDTYLDRIAGLPVFGAFDESRLVGTAILGISGRDRTKMRHKCEVWSVYVAPEARGRGAGRAMMQELIGEARRRGYEALVLSVSSHNVVGVRLYRALGFERYGTERRAFKLPDGAYVDEDLMQLDL